MPQFRNLERPWLISALLVLAVFAAYLPAVYLNFINFDDPLYIYQNRYMQQGFTMESLRWAFTQSHAANWHPLTWLSHMLDYKLYGPNPLGHHVTNVVFHAANAVILFLWLRSMTGAVWRSALVAAIFALHPLRVESVAWASERKDVLSTSLGLLSLWAYTRYARGRGDQNPKPEGQRRRIGFYILSLVFFVLGLLSKPMLVTWPFLMLLLDYWPLDRFKTAAGPTAAKPALDFSFKRIALLVGEKLPFFALAAATCVATFLAQQEGGAVSHLGGDYGVSISSRLCNMPISYARYLWKLIWPHDMAIIYPLVREWPEEDVFICATLILAISASVLWYARRKPYLPVGWFWYLGSAIPIIGLVQVGTQSIADRYTYIPAIGLAIMMVWGVADLVARWQEGWKPVAGAAAAVLLAYTFIDGRQLLYWQNPETVFRHALAVTDRNYMAYSLLGSYFSELGDLEPAKAEYHKALIFAPENPRPWNNLGCALLVQKDYAGAIEAFRHVLDVRPRSVDAENNIANALFTIGQTDEALKHYRKAVEIEPDNVEAQYNLGNMLTRMNQPGEAEEHLRIALRLNPRYVPAHAFLGSVLALGGKTDQAAAEFKAALALDPKSTVTLYGYASFLTTLGKWDEAEQQYAKIVQLQPRDTLARTQLGISQAAQGNLDKAYDSFLTVLQADPTNAIANYRMATTLTSLHKFEQAIPFYRESLKFAPDTPAALNNLAWVLAANPDPKLRNGPEAVRLAERACQLTDYQEPLIVGTLAAAYAEAGRFSDAVAAGEKARALSEAAGDKDLSKRNAELLALYRAGLPYRDTR